MKPANSHILTINGGSLSIKFALFESGDSLQRILGGGTEHIGLPDATLQVKGLNPADNVSRLVSAPDHMVAVGALMDWFEAHSSHDALTAVGHRVVHGGPTYSQPQRITPAMLEELHRISPFDPEHLPEEIQLTEAFHTAFQTCPKSRVSTRRFTMTCRASPRCYPSHAVTKARAHDGMGSTGCPMRS